MRKQMISVVTCSRLRENTIGTSGAKKAIANSTTFRALVLCHNAVPSLSLSFMCTDTLPVHANLPDLSCQLNRRVRTSPATYESPEPLSTAISAQREIPRQENALSSRVAFLGQSRRFA
jgi:hypothetical protein